MSHEPKRPKTPLSPGRRQALGALGALSATPLIGLASSEAEAAWSEQFDAGDLELARSCALIPEETAGPYPLLSVLEDPKMVRRDVTEGKPGVPLTLTMKLVDVNAGCAPIADAAVYIWCCDKDGVYSGYKQPGHDTRGQTFMRGIQMSNAKGLLRFTAIYPGWYPGRITHIHFQVYLDADLGGTATATSQLAFPQEATFAVYDSPLYAAKGQNTTVSGFKQDGVFADGVKLQLTKVKGSVDSGYTAKLMVGIVA